MKYLGLLSFQTRFFAAISLCCKSDSRALSLESSKFGENMRCRMVIAFPLYTMKAIQEMLFLSQTILG